MGDRLPRLFVASIPDATQSVSLASAEMRHARVLRLRAGAQLVLFDGRGGEADAVVVTADKANVRCEVQARRTLPQPTQRLTLLLGMTKADKPELVVRMSSELGVFALRFVTCKHSVVRGAGDGRFDRLRQIALEACAQSGNAHAPIIEEPVPLLTAAAMAPENSVRFAYWERATEAPKVWPSEVNDVWAIVGPEGGLADTEMEALSALGFSPVALRTPILRAETAAVVVAARLTERLSRP